MSGEQHAETCSQHPEVEGTGKTPTVVVTAARTFSLVDRFVCRRGGHKPTVTLFVGPVTKEPYMTTCQRCGKWYEAEPVVKP